MADYKLLVGDCLSSMHQMEDCSVDCCVTSPPYFALRDYDMDGQIGLEGTPEDFIDSLVEVFREVRRVLKDDGSMWVVIGDTYVGTGAKGEHLDPKNPFGRNSQRTTPKNQKVAGIKSKDLIGIPWMLAFALRNDGWYLRSDSIWYKPNAMPEPVRDRPTKSHEYVFLLSKAPHYHYDYEAVMEEAVGGGYRNKRSVCLVNTKPFVGSHFATYPPELIEPFILASCPEGGVVLDPFGGSGTTAGVAIRNRRNAILCELNPEYANLVDRRVSEIVAEGPRAAEPDLIEMFGLYD